MCHALHISFQGHRLPLQGLLCSLFYPVLQPQLPCSIHLITLSGVSPSFHLPELIAHIYFRQDYMELVLYRLRVPKVVARTLGLGCAHMDGHRINGLEIPIVPQFPNKYSPNRDDFAGVANGPSWPQNLQTPSDSCVACADSSYRHLPTPRSVCSTSYGSPLDGR
jgi:hypothetical protein